MARGLAALQSDPNVPPQLVELAAPIAQSMGALHQIERSNGAQLMPHANIALENVRMALAKLQSHPATHPAVATAMEAVASSLGLVHALSRLAGPAAPQAAPQAPMAQQPMAPQPMAAQPMAHQPMPQQPMAQQPMAQQPQHAAFAPTAPAAFPPTQPQQPMMQPQHAMPPQQQGGFVNQRPAHVAPMAQTVAAPQSHGGGFAPAPMHNAPAPAPMHHAPAAPMHAPAPAPAAGGGFARDPFAAGGAAPAAGGDDKLVIPADLGAQSPTNFYKGLSGNDIVDHGGLFVSTYMIPKIGTPVRLRVSLPGGYEFEADAVVRWARDVRDASSDAPPGFGAQLTGVSNEARQLIYRYVRNREPLFHDDL